MINLEINFRTVFIISAIIVLTLPLNALAQDVSSQLALNEASPSTQAEYTYTKSATLAVEKHYSDAQLAMNLIRSAIPSPKYDYYIGSLPPMDTPWKGGHSLDSPEGYRQQYPWLYEFLYRERGVPRFYATSKWTQPIKVAFGFPNNLKPYAEYKGEGAQSNLYSFFKVSDNPEVYAFAKKVVQPYLNTITDLTSLPATFLENEDDNSFGNIRIIFVDSTTLWKTEYKFSRSSIEVRPSSPNVLFRGTLESLHLNTAVHFTPDTLYQVDGYILPNADNSIGMAFCYIWEGHPKEMAKLLIQECLLRSLGIPGQVYAKPKGLLSYWNSPKVERVYQDSFESAEGEVVLQDLSISKLERETIRFLYSSKVNSGMTAMDIYWTFMAKNK